MIELFMRASKRDVTIAVGRTIEGIALTWNQIDRVSDNGGHTFYKETFLPNAAEKNLSERASIPLPLGLLHPWQTESENDEPIGDVRFRADNEHLYFRARIAKTDQGSEVLAAVREHGSAVSVAFRDYKADWNGDVKVHQEIGLHELSLIPGNSELRAQHEGAQVLALRATMPYSSADRLKWARQRAALNLWLPMHDR